MKIFGEIKKARFCGKKLRRKIVDKIKEIMLYSAKIERKQKILN